jgi:hypothetical protein
MPRLFFALALLAGIAGATAITAYLTAAPALATPCDGC